MKEFIEKLIGRLEERKSEVNGLSDIVWNNAVKMCIDDVNQLAEEYKGGWIPCSERLPEENEKVIACFATGTVTELDFYNGLFHGLFNYSTNVIIAWQPLPAPYQQKEVKA